MKRKLIITLSVFALVFACLLPASTALAATSQQVSITVTAATVAITNSQATWGIGSVDVDDIKYFSADNNQDDDYSRITNTGNSACDIEIQGVNIEGGSYDWTLAAAAGNQTYSLHAGSGNASASYTLEVKSSAYNDLTTSLAASDVWDWSLKFVAPNEFNAADDGAEKSGSVTLVASKS